MAIQRVWLLLAPAVLFSASACQDHTVQIVHEAPSVTILEPADGASVYEGKPIQFRAKVVAPGLAQGESITQVTHRWVSGSITACDAETVDANGEGICSFTFDDVGVQVMQVTVTDPHQDTASASITLQVLENTPPTIDILSPQEGDAFSPTDLIVFDALVDDAEDSPDELTVEVRSSKDGVLFAPGEISAATSGVWSAGTSGLTNGEHLITMKVTDASSSSHQDSVKILINARPSAPGVSITPDPAKSGWELTGHVDTQSVDPEGDPISYYYEWFINGALYSAGTDPQVPLAVTVRDDFVELNVSAYDGYGYGNPGKATITIDNSPPTIDSVTLTSPAYTDDDVLATPVGFFDQDGDPQRVRYAWFINGALDTSETTDTFPASKTVRGDQLQASVTPFDSYEAGLPVLSGTLTISNTPPTQPVVTISPSSPEPEDDLYCEITTHSEDLDDDAITYVYAWYRNGTLTSITSNLVDSTYTAHGDSWECVVTPTDGTVSGTTNNDVVTVYDVTSPDDPTIDTPEAYRNEDEVTLTGTCEASCDLTFHCSDSSTSWTEADTCDTDDTFTHDVSLTRGEVTACYVTCEDSAGNVSGNSNVVDTEVCDPYDEYEDTAGYGNAGADAIDEWATLSDAGTTTITIEGNIIGSDTVDWYLVSTSDDNAANISAYYNSYNFDVELSTGSGTYSFMVYKGGYDASYAECSTSTSGYTEYNDFWESSWSGTPDCYTGSVYGYDNCSSLANDYYIKVMRDSTVSESCDYYELTITNGL